MKIPFNFISHILRNILTDKKLIYTNEILFKFWFTNLTMINYRLDWPKNIPKYHHWKYLYKNCYYFFRICFRSYIPIAESTHSHKSKIKWCDILSLDALMDQNLLVVIIIVEIKPRIVSLGNILLSYCEENTCYEMRSEKEDK